MWTAPNIPARLPGWDRAYADMLQRLADEPFAWGTADCIARPCDLCEAMTGVNPFPRTQRRYRTAAGAARLLSRFGFSDIEQALASTFPDIPKAKARRGDCGIAEVRIDGEMILSTFIVMGVNALGSNERGPVVIPTLRLKRTFQVG